MLITEIGKRRAKLARDAGLHPDFVIIGVKQSNMLSQELGAMRRYGGHNADLGQVYGMALVLVGLEDFLDFGYFSPDNQNAALLNSKQIRGMPLNRVIIDEYHR
jgi:hypothetical protein